MPKYLLDFIYIGVSWLAAVSDGHSSGHSGSMTNDKTIGYQANQIGHTQITTDAPACGKDIIDGLWD